MKYIYLFPVLRTSMGFLLRLVLIPVLRTSIYKYSRCYAPCRGFKLRVGLRSCFIFPVLRTYSLPRVISNLKLLSFLKLGCFIKNYCRPYKSRHADDADSNRYHGLMAANPVETLHATSSMSGSILYMKTMRLYFDDADSYRYHGLGAAITVETLHATSSCMQRLHRSVLFIIT